MMPPPPNMMPVPEAPVSTPDVEETPCFDPEANVGPHDIDAGEGQPLSQTERRENICRRAMDVLEEYRSNTARKRAELKWMLNYRVVMGWRETRDPDEIVLRECWRQLMTILPQFKGLNLQDFSYKTRVSGGEKLAAAATAVVKDMYQRFDSEAEERMAKKVMFMLGISYLVPTWTRFKLTERKIRSLHSADEPTEWERKTSEVIEDGAKLVFVHPKKVFTHPQVVDAANSPMVFVVDGYSTDAIKTEVRANYLDKDAAEECINAMQAAYRENEYGRSAPDRDDLMLEGDLALHTYVTVWTADGWEYVVCDEKFLLRAHKLQDGKIPIVTLQYDAMPDEHYSEGLIDKLAPSQRVVNQMMTYTMKAIGFAAQPILKTKNSTAVSKKWKDTKIKCGNTVECDNMEDVQWMDFPADRIPMLQQTVGFMQSHQKDETGINDRISGQGDNTGTASLGVSLIKAATGRLEYLMDGLVPKYRMLHRWMYNLCARHLNRVYSVRVAGADGEILPQQYKPEIFEPDVDQEVIIGAPSGQDQVLMWGNILKMAGGMPGVNNMAIFDRVLQAADDKIRLDDFHTSGPNQQSNAVAETVQVMTNGLMPEPKPSDDHQTHLAIHIMAMQTPGFLQTPPAYQQRMQAHVATHQAFMQQQEAANAQMQQQAMLQQGGGQGPGGGATPVQQNSNQLANGLFGMDQRGAQQGAA